METSQEPTTRCLRIRQAMQMHVQDRLQQTLAKLDGKKEDAVVKKKKQEALDKFQLDLILEKGAAAASQIAIASHIAKGIHPDLKVKEVSNLAVNFASLPDLQELGSHALANMCKSLLDTTGNGSYNAAAYELYLLLDSEFEGVKLAHLLEQQDADAIAAFEMGQQKGFADQCVELLQNKCSTTAAHTYSKQIFWLNDGADPSEDANFEVLVPLYPASLVHQVYQRIQEHFGEANKAARQARRERKPHDGVYYDYPGLAVKKLGGTKPQNISQLNSERGGVNYLLSSQPPVWATSTQRLPVNAESVFARLFGARPDVLRTLKALRDFLAKDPEPNLETRQRRDALVDKLIDELVALAGELQQMQPGWTRDDDRFAQLHRAEQLWLDPLRAELPEEDDFTQEWLALEWPAEIGKRFGRWLNQQLQNRLPVGDVEARAWAKELLADEDGFREHLRTLRRRLSKREVAA